MAVKKKKLLTKHGCMAFALKQWNRIAAEHDIPQTQRKDDDRMAVVRKVIKRMESHGMDWREKEVWRKFFRKVAEEHKKIEAASGKPTFRVTYDWAMKIKNTSHFYETVE